MAAESGGAAVASRAGAERSEVRGSDVDGVAGELQERNRGEQRLRVRMLRIGEERVGGAALHHDAVIHYEHAVTDALDDAEVVRLTSDIQRELFKIGSALATPPESPKPQVPIDVEMVDRLTAEVHRFEAIEGILSDWSVPGAHSVAAAFDMARTVCRRAERCVVRVREAGESVQPAIVPYLNRLSDLLWLIGRKLEHEAGVSGSLRADTGKAGNRWSRAW